MLQKVNRLTRDKEFDNVFKNGRSSYGSILGVKAVANQKAASRVGVLVSTKISKKAVERNRIKRQIREVIRLQIDKIKTNQDIVVITLPPIKGKDYSEIKTALNVNFKKLNLYK